MTQFTFIMSEAQARRLHKLIDSQCGALKNYTASAVEEGDLITAQEHVVELRACQALYAATNIDAKYTIAKGSNTPLQTEVYVQDSK